MPLICEFTYLEANEGVYLFCPNIIQKDIPTQGRRQNKWDISFVGNNNQEDIPTRGDSRFAAAAPEWVYVFD